MVVFLVVSLVLALALRPLTTKLLRGTAIPTNADRLIGLRTTLLEAITHEVGTLKAGGLVWNAVSYDGKPIEKGSEVEILALEGNKLIVKDIH